MQRFKSIYFSDYPGVDARRNLTLAFGPADADLHRTVEPLTSEDMRRLLQCDTYRQLKASAEATALSLNSYSLRRLRTSLVLPNDRGPSRSVIENDGEYAAQRQPSFHLNPVQATFRGGAAEPLHDWYPYLEGYSPDFVRSVINAFAPEARSVLDPFAGTGTTPLTAVRMGKAGFYCELNPLLQLLVETKSAVLASTEKDRLGVVRGLLAAADKLSNLRREHERDRDLAAAYDNAFGDSSFFTPDAFDCCLRLRKWLDSLAHEAQLVADLATLAVLRSLVPCSKMIRRGDLRFRRGAEYAAIKRDMVREVAAQIRVMARTITDLDGASGRPMFMMGNAKSLDRMAVLDVDSIVTSPPYLNGTNYYRNSKIELWFLRELASTEDLTAYRKATVTAGINDVIGGTRPAPATATVERLVRELGERAYDRRIPTMAAMYFSDMQQVFSGLTYHAGRAAVLAMDIGDSCYAGVHVDTPRILGELLSAAGWTLRQEHILRRRLSRSQHSLRQVLITATAPRPRSQRYRERIGRPPRWQAKWSSFKSSLPHRSGAYQRRNWGSPLHSLCSYQGKLKPSLAHHLVGIFASPGDRLLDPFGGVGTIAFEAARHGVLSWSFDLSPAAVVIARAKLDPASSEMCHAVLRELEAFIHTNRPSECERSRASSIRFNGALPDYYHPQTFDEILLARRYFLENRPTDAARAMIFSCILHVLHGNRPYALSRRSHPLTPFAPSGAAHYRSLIDRTTAKLERASSADTGTEFVPGSSLFQDATASWPLDVDGLDAVITSPPFYDSTRFYLANWIRLWFSGWDDEDFRVLPRAFVDERQKQSFDVYRSVIRQVRERLNPNGVLVLHLGKSRKCDMADQISHVAKPWFRYSETFAENVTHCESHGIRDKGTVSEHTYLVLS